MKTRRNPALFFKAILKNFFFINGREKNQTENIPQETASEYQSNWEKEYVEFYRQGTRWQTN